MSHILIKTTACLMLASYSHSICLSVRSLVLLMLSLSTCYFTTATCSHQLTPLGLSSRIGPKWIKFLLPPFLIDGSVIWFYSYLSNGNIWMWCIVYFWIHILFWKMNICKCRHTTTWRVRLFPELISQCWLTYVWLSLCFKYSITHFWKVVTCIPLTLRLVLTCPAVASCIFSTYFCSQDLSSGCYN